MSDAASQPCWIPERIVTGDHGGISCRWIDVAGLRFTEPFFDSTLRRRHRNAPAERWSTIPELLEEASRVPEVDDVVFIFHVSRCGSTLLSQLFGLDTRTLVLSETPLLDSILTSADDEREGLFDAALRLLARPRDGGASRLVVKTDCWHLLHAPTLRRLYPRARFVLLYRRAAAVLGSHQKMRGMHMAPGCIAALSHVAYDPERLTLEQYGAIVLAHYYSAMLDVAAADDRSLLTCYEEGFPAAFLRTGAWLGLSFDPGRLSRIHERCGYHGKRPHEPFGTETPPVLADVDFAPLDALYAALEQCRTGVLQPSSPT